MLFELVPQHPIVSPHWQRISPGLSNAASTFIFISYRGDFLSGRFRADIWYCGLCVGGGASAKERSDETFACGDGGKETEGMRTDRKERKEEKVRPGGAKIIENGSPRGRLNQAAASSVCSVIAGNADQVVSEVAERRPEEKQAGMWSESDRGGEGKGTGLVVEAGRVRVRAVVA